jgi:exodeoxyribonuclease VII large subunit
VRSVAISPDTRTTPRVSHLATSIQRALREVGSGWVEGEVQKLRRAGSGHVYFSLADEDATIECCVWRSRAGRIAQWPSEGTLVQVHFEKVDFYGRSGRVSLHVDAIRLTGEGELLARKQATLDKLTADGLVVRARRPLPGFPRRVGVIAARDSDARTDVIKALRERWPGVHIVHRAALVEGVRAVDSVIAALAHLQDIDAMDVIVLARGGGGVRDLVAFDDERLCRAVFACAVPVVTSIGHTAQRPNCDHVAAAYADVPARTAELVVPSAAELTAELDRHRVVLESVPEILSGRREDLTSLWERARPRQGLQRRLLELDGLDGRLEQAAASFYAERQRVLDDSRHRLARVRSRVPVPSVLDLSSQQLHAVAARFFADRTGELDTAGRELAATRARMPAPEEVAQLAARLTPAAARARRRTQDFERAFHRMREHADRTFARRLREHDRDVADAAAELATTARRRLTDAQTALGHVVELIAAKDLRRSGWLLAGDRDGRAVGSIAGVVPGAELTLRFHDGVADAAVTHVHQQEGEGHV